MASSKKETLKRDETNQQEMELEIIAEEDIDSDDLLFGRCPASGRCAPEPSEPSVDN